MHTSRIASQCSLAVLQALSVVVAAENAGAVDLIGYVPYYRMNNSYNANTLPAQLAMLDEVRYFGLTAASNGTITTLDGGSVASHTNRINIIKDAIAALPEEDRPRLNITFGGAGQAASFATIAASATLRATFAQNIEALLDQTGATSIDLDWEHPVGTTQFNNYATMLTQIKQEVGASRRVYATIDPTIWVPLSVLDGPDGIDGISLMTYELAWWANDPNDFNRGEHSLPEYVEDSVAAWTDPSGSPNQRPWVFASWGRNAPEDKLGIGLPFFGRVIGTSQAPMAGAAYLYSELANGGTTTDGNYYTYSGQTVWAVGPSLAAERVAFAHEHGLQHVIIWELAQDLNPTDPRSLLRSAFEAKQALLAVPGDYDGDRDVDPNDFGVWRSTFGSQSDLRADGNGDLRVNAADYVVWRKYATTSGGGAATALVPEPNAGYLLCLWLYSILLPRAQCTRVN
jgi:GH18 family chitinase